MDFQTYSDSDSAFILESPSSSLVAIHHYQTKVNKDTLNSYLCMSGQIKHQIGLEFLV